MTRVSENQLTQRLTYAIQQNRDITNILGEQISSGIRVSKPSDSPAAGDVARFQSTLQRIESFKNGVAQTKSFLNFQEDALDQSSSIIVRAKEIATQAANETNSVEARRSLAAEIFQIRDHLVSLANSTYQGKYVWGGADDDDQPFDQQAYTNPATGEANERWVFDAEVGTSLMRDVKLTDDLTITVNSNGNTIFGGAIAALERLGRSLEGYRTDPLVGTPTGAGTAYTFPTDYQEQTTNIKAALDLLETERSSSILNERVTIGGKMRRIETAESLIAVTKVTSEEALDSLQNTDLTDAASKLSLAQNALQASYIVSNKVMNLSILDYI